MSSHASEERNTKRAAARRRLLSEIKKAVRTIERDIEARDALIRQAVAARVPRQDIMAATGLSRSRIYQIATGTDAPESSHK
ncbi:hypothetical protein [Arthrobacter sp. efr-133-TYG-118]|uniref:hypothetical protein n=1 Tax=Arthrobacter sp. efr-133-TYG-118 TaxID=3040279 RepID=UPI002551C23D|nr:hypothetical protein [Arthrobacter sp. efr-133-TYG-118]